MLDIRDENLRLIYAEQEAEYIRAGTRKAVRRLVVHGFLLTFIAVLLISGQVFNADSAVEKIGRSIGEYFSDALENVFAIVVLGFVFVVPWFSALYIIQAFATLMKFRSFQKNHRELLDRYQRSN